MDRQLRRRFRVEAGLSDASVALFVLTLAFPEWIEALTGLEPDAGSGSLELAIAGAFLLLAITSGLLARRDHRRLGLGQTSDT
jgi:hypothetical protein